MQVGSSCSTIYVSLYKSLEAEKHVANWSNIAVLQN